MKRDLSALGKSRFDLLVVGGGILGACVAWDASLRGLSVALVDKGDFASGTSSNSLKIVHGGLRYLQHLDFRRMRESIRERSIWLRIAPHLVEPLPILVPTYGHGLKSRAILRIALAVNDVIAADRNRGLLPDRQLPAGRSVSRAECLRLVPELPRRGLTGGVLFHDAQLYNSERLVLEVIEAASRSGAVVSNYVEVSAPLVENGRLAGVLVRDTLSKERFSTRASYVVNAAGPAAPALAARLTARPEAAATSYSVAMNLMVKSLGHRVAFAIFGSAQDDAAVLKRGKRQLFIVPWRDQAIIGTAHYPYDDDPANFRNREREREIEMFLREINGGWYGEPFTRDGVALVHSGLLPAQGRKREGYVNLLKHPRIIDHIADGTPEVITAVSVKYTTGRLVAERVVDLVCRKLGRCGLSCRTLFTPLPGAPSESLQSLQEKAARRHGDDLDGEVLRHLVRSYGSRYESILTYRNSHVDWKKSVAPPAPVIRAQLLHGVREEMALKTDDLLHRRTELEARGLISENAMRCAEEVLRSERASISGTKPPG